MPRGRPRKNQDDVLLRSAEMVGWALGGIEREIVQTRERLAALTNHATKLRAQLLGRAGGGATGASSTAGGGTGTAAKAPGNGRRRRRMSPEARRRISEMMKKRWAERRKGKG
jgi:hypothetical protein